MRENRCIHTRPSPVPESASGGPSPGVSGASDSSSVQGKRRGRGGRRDGRAAEGRVVATAEGGESASAALHAPPAAARHPPPAPANGSTQGEHSEPNSNADDDLPLHPPIPQPEAPGGRKKQKRQPENRGEPNGAKKGGRNKARDAVKSGVGTMVTAEGGKSASAAPYAPPAAAAAAHHLPPTPANGSTQGEHPEANPNADDDLPLRPPVPQPEAPGGRKKRKRQPEDRGEPSGAKKGGRAEAGEGDGGGEVQRKKRIRGEKKARERRDRARPPCSPQDVTDEQKEKDDGRPCQAEIGAEKDSANNLFDCGDGVCTSTESRRSRRPSRRQSLLQLSRASAINEPMAEALLRIRAEVEYLKKRTDHKPKIRTDQEFWAEIEKRYELQRIDLWKVDKKTSLKPLGETQIKKFFSMSDREEIGREVGLDRLDQADPDCPGSATTAAATSSELPRDPLAQGVAIDSYDDAEWGVNLPSREQPPQKPLLVRSSAESNSMGVRWFKSKSGISVPIDFEAAREAWEAAPIVEPGGRKCSQCGKKKDYTSHPRIPPTNL
uniref:Uncharacterized protein n=1 Tax=Chromera velia CCMP2878 TaxID=1169474 RepID=A0A0G4GLB4_9ALVE|eukprot:Cvel_4853.t1-p1 / transcript=Cvel_4853.t1 / gene=Cvel_4853 / organism=Chromera_velia_CCMP2878 / gene_product=hypothetical protein / transcript_product=hypothetical protein / location=Cvel_scaffold219:5888-7898(-) / protein_length=550 / sequence_SO=supercontig / SO=protein_coding / is_pseudo=false